MSSISGFPEWLPAQQGVLDLWKKILSQHFQSFCFTPMDTPVVERMSTLLSKGDDSEIYALMRWADVANTTANTTAQDSAQNFDQKNGMDIQRQLGLRFDLTVPLARYVTEHHGQLVFPYRRYHIAPVWRGERPQEGRFRQFYQCDIDTIDQENLAQSCDGETIFVLHSALQALDIDSFLGPVQWHINHRAVLLFWAQHAGIQDANAALRWIDKSEKIGLDALLNGLKTLNASPSSLEMLVSWSDYHKPACDHINALLSCNGPTELHRALNDLKKMIHSLVVRGMAPENILFNPLLARGLSYYSGLTFEAKLSHHPDLGSICAGGRYDHLATTLDAKKTFPGVGGSLGLSRLFSRFVEHTQPALQSGDILICAQESESVDWYIQLGDQLRHHGWRVEVFLKELPLKHQLRYANRKGFPVVVLANAQEISENCVQLKNMSNRMQAVVPVSDIVATLKTWLAHP